MASNALECAEGIRLLREDETVKVHYLDTGREVELDATQPVQMLNTVTANDDATVVEVCDTRSVTVTQMTEAGETQTIVLSPRMAVELTRILDSLVFFPAGFQLPPQ